MVLAITFCIIGCSGLLGSIIPALANDADEFHCKWGTCDVFKDPNYHQYVSDFSHKSFKIEWQAENYRIDV